MHASVLCSWVGPTAPISWPRWASGEMVDHTVDPNDRRAQQGKRHICIYMYIHTGKLFPFTDAYCSKFDSLMYCSEQYPLSDCALHACGADGSAVMAQGITANQSTKHSPSVCDMTGNAAMQMPWHLSTAGELLRLAFLYGMLLHMKYARVFQQPVLYRHKWPTSTWHAWHLEMSYGSEQTLKGQLNKISPHTC